MPQSVALSPDGHRIAWIDYHASNNETVVVFGKLSDDRAGSLRRVSRDAGGGCAPCLDEVSGVAWAGDNTLLLSRDGQDDEGAGLGRLPLDDRHVSQGWYDGASSIRPPSADADYRYFDFVVSASANTALAIERPSYNGPPPRGIRARAVMLDLTTGRRVAIVATALPGRDVTAVSGGPAGVVYRTVSGYEADPRFYLRLPGDTSGQRITGLPHDAVNVIAQPS